MTYSHTKRAEVLPGIYCGTSRGVIYVFGRFSLPVTTLKLLFSSIIRSMTSLLYLLKFRLLVLLNPGNITKFYLGKITGFRVIIDGKDDIEK